MKYGIFIISFALMFLLFSCIDKSDEKKELKKIVHAINNDLINIKLENEKLAEFTASLYLKKNEIIPVIDKSKYSISKNGVMYKKKMTVIQLFLFLEQFL